MKHVDINEANTHLSKILDESSAGEFFIITKVGIPVAKLCPVHEAPKKKFIFGLMKNQIKLAADFDDPIFL
ncbi:MAG: type II toxin-antitoxin system prevent-host-death family antitoxin [Gammaproteobacteria bacterium]|nr:type II toxin-antitoxin system prevent-host-death family antitoxin [Gammaproteobacteria bacterium]